MVKRSAEKRSQGRNDIGFNTLNNLTSRLQHSMRQNLKLIDDYIIGQIVPHLHMRVRRRDGGPGSRDYCAIYQWPSEECFRSSNCRAWATESASAYRRLNDMKSAVLVDVTKLIKLPKGVKMVPLPAMIRLQPLDDCLRTWVNCLYLPQATFFTRPPTVITLPVQYRGLEDGELAVPEDSGVIGIERRQPINKVVEYSPRIVQKIPEDESDSWGWFQVYAEDGGDDDITSNLLLNLTLESIRVSVNVGGNFVFERLETLLRPAEFEGDVVSGLHGVQSYYEQHSYSQGIIAKRLNAYIRKSVPSNSV